MEGAKQHNLIITRPGEQPTVTVDNIEVAQFIYLLLHNQKIRDVIDTITSKAVLILGRFTDERKAVLEVTAVCNAGALGSLGCGPLPTQAVRDQVEEIRRTTNRPFNLNFFAHTAPHIDAGAARRVGERLAVYYDELGLGAVPEPIDPLPRFDEERLRLILDLQPRVVSFHFGLPPREVLTRIKRVGCVVLSSATTVAEARALEAQGADAIIAQGFEAGGHRGTFTSGGGAGLTGTMALVPQVVDAVRVPVIAAGGIADGRGLAAAFALGASGVQIGTAFLGCPEATVSDPYREALHRAADEDTRLTRVFTGRPARALRNRLIDEMGDAEALEFPVQLSLIQGLVKANSDASRAGFLPLWAGQAAPLIRDLPAARLIETFVAECRDRLPTIGGSRSSEHRVRSALA